MKRVLMLQAGTSNLRIVHYQGKHRLATEALKNEVLEIAEAIVLAIVAVATAWAGYQAALWGGQQSKMYGQASNLRSKADGITTTAYQERLYLAATVVEWLKADARGERELANIFERRLLPEFRPTFDVWKKTSPTRNPNAPPWPQLMSDYRTPKTDEAARLAQQASQLFDQGTRARQRSDDYVRVTLILAVILVLTSI